VILVQHLEEKNKENEMKLANLKKKAKKVSQIKQRIGETKQVTKSLNLKAQEM